MHIEIINQPKSVGCFSCEYCQAKQQIVLTFYNLQFLSIFQTNIIYQNRAFTNKMWKKRFILQAQEDGNNVNGQQSKRFKVLLSNQKYL